MKAVRNYGIGDVRVEEIIKPSTKEGESLIKILYSGICGSDMHIYKKGMFITYTPETMGHEFVGIVIDSNGGPIKNGEYVVGDPRVPCEECSACKEGNYQRCLNLAFIGEVKQGCFTEYISMPFNKLIPVNNIENTEQLALVEPLAVAIHICEEAGLKEEQNIVIYGCGPIGLLTVILAKNIYEVKTITSIDIAEGRLEVAKKFGADYVYRDVNESEIKEYDVAFEVAGIGVTFQEALNCLKPYGKLAMVGIFENTAEVDLNPLINKELKIIGSNTYTTDDLKKAADIISSQKIDLSQIITRIVSLDDAPEMFKLLSQKNKKDLKILFKI